MSSENQINVRVAFFHTLLNTFLLSHAAAKADDLLLNAQRTANSRSEEIIGQAQQAAAQIKQKIERQKTKYGWEFLFLGANIDALETAERYGIDRSRAVQFHNDAQGVEVNYRVLSEAVADVRCACSIAPDWAAEIEADYSSRPD